MVYTDKAQHNFLPRNLHTLADACEKTTFPQKSFPLSAFVINKGAAWPLAAAPLSILSLLKSLDQGREVLFIQTLQNSQ
jgi:hypothetical protein